MPDLKPFSAAVQLSPDRDIYLHDQLGVGLLEPIDDLLGTFTMMDGRTCTVPCADPYLWRIDTQPTRPCQLALALVDTLLNARWPTDQLHTWELATRQFKYIGQDSGRIYVTDLGHASWQLVVEWNALQENQFSRYLEDRSSLPTLPSLPPVQRTKFTANNGAFTLRV